MRLTDNEIIKLPPLSGVSPDHGIGKAMQDYGRAAVLADRQRLAKSEATDADTFIAPDFDRESNLSRALDALTREAQVVADDHHRPRYARLDEAIQSARAALAAPAAPQAARGERESFYAKGVEGKQHDTGRVIVRTSGKPHDNFFASTCSLEDAQRIAAALNAAAAPQAGEDARPVAWQPLTDEDRQAAFEALPDALEGFLKKWGWLHFANEIERRCKEKNSALTTQGASHAD